MSSASPKAKSKVLFFAPYSAIWRSAFPEALIAECIKKSGNEVIYVTCGRMFKEYCIGMSSVSLTPESSEEDKEKICLQCTRHKSLLRKQFDLSGYDVSSKITKEDEKAVDEVLRRVTQNNFHELILDGIEVGNLAIYEFLLQHKKRAIQFSDSEWTRYRITLKNALFAFFGGRRILESEKPDMLVVYNGLYSTNAVVCKLAEKKGIPYYFLHAGPNLAHRIQTMMFGRGHVFNFFEELKGHWADQKDVPCNRQELSAVADHFVELFSGRNVFVYSAPKMKEQFKVRPFFGIKESQKVLVAVLGSYDEQLAAEEAGFFPSEYPVLFKTQMDWVKSLIAYVKDRPELFLIIRVHPREFPNRRDSRKSEQATQIQSELQDLPFNVKVNFPSDNLSVYDLAEGTDLFLSSWSSVGKEMALLGIPVIVYSQLLIGYSADINILATTERDYFEAIEKALKTGWDFERIRMAFRWYVLEQVRSVHDLSDACHISEDRPALPIRVFKKVIGKIDPIFFQRIDCERRPKKLTAQDSIGRIVDERLSSILDFKEKNVSRQIVTKNQETLFIKNELRRLVKAMYGSYKRNPAEISLRDKLIKASLD